MIRTVALPLVALGTLTACAGDNPQNVPLYGQWEMERTIDSVSIDGMIFSAADLPADMLQMAETESICGEPLYIDSNWQAEDIASRTGGQCTLGEYSHTATGATFSGTCEIEGDGADYSPALSGRSTFSETQSRDVITMEGTIMLPGDPSPHVMRIIAVQEGTRTGDC